MRWAGAGRLMGRAGGALNAGSRRADCLPLWVTLLVLGRGECWTPIRAGMMMGRHRLLR
jgi:hypothetical protein